MIKKEKHIAFSGTRNGMTEIQKGQFESILIKLDGDYFHHGDCIGADAEANDIARALGYIIIIHPPENEKYRAFCVAEESRKKKGYLDRNHDIVDESDLLVATPAASKEKLRSGTWATIRYAKKKKKEVIIIEP